MKHLKVFEDFDNESISYISSCPYKNEVNKVLDRFRDTIEDRLSDLDFIKCISGINTYSGCNVNVNVNAESNRYKQYHSTEDSEPSSLSIKIRIEPNVPSKDHYQAYYDGKEIYESISPLLSDLKENNVVLIQFYIHNRDTNYGGIDSFPPEGNSRIQNYTVGRDVYDVLSIELPKREVHEINLVFEVEDPQLFIPVGRNRK